MTTTKQPTSDTSDREITISRVLAAPRELVWQAMTEPQHVTNWWGPHGFTTTIDTMEVRPGGTWKHVMHGPDGSDYPNKSIFREVVKPERIVFAHAGGKKGAPGATFVATWTFEEIKPGQTKVTIHMVFPTPEERDTVVKVYGALEGGKQTLDRLADFVPVMGRVTRPFVLTRTFDAPRDLVWQVWTDREHLMRWFSPKGFARSTATMDCRPGGTFLYCMRMPDGKEMWGKWIFREIVKPEKLVVVTSFSDAQGGITRHPLSATWPLETYSRTTFAEKDGKTTITVEWSAYNPTDAERKTFDESHDGMRMGWGGTMEQLTAYLAQVQAEKGKTS